MRGQLRRLLRRQLIRTAIVIAIVGGGASLSAHATVLQAGAGQMYASACAALVDAKTGDEIDVASGTYTDSCEVNVDGVTIKGVGATRPILDASASDHPADYKGIFVVTAANVRIENLELTGAHIPVDTTYGGNGAGIRAVGDGLVVHGCYIHDNQDGILGTPADSTGTITIENTELARNGMGDACDVTSCTHNVYINGYAKLVFQYNWSHSVATDTPNKGHLLKSRALESDILYNRLSGEDGFDSYELDLPNGGKAIVVGNVIEKGTMAGNEYLLRYGEEGLSNPDMRLFIAYNTFVNDLGKGTFIDVASGGTLTAHDNFLVGVGTPFGQGTLSADNVATMTPEFVAASSYDYHLVAGSPAIGVAVDPGSADTMSLTPTLEYVETTSSAPRAGTHDVGAFENGSVVVGDAGVAPIDAGATDASASKLSSTKGCGCDVGGSRTHATWSLVLVGVLALLRRRLHIE